MKKIVKSNFFKSSIIKSIIAYTFCISIMGATVTQSRATQMKSPPTKTLEMGFGFYVGGLHIIDAKTLFVPNNKNSTYDFTAIASTIGFTDWVTGFFGKSTSTGTLNNNGPVKSKYHTNTSYSNFGENYSELFLGKNVAKLIRYPDRNEQNLVNLDGNPLAKANDPVATLLNIMVQVGDTDRCAKNLIVIANHFLYTMKALNTNTAVLEETDYNIASGKVITCELDFVRLDKEDNLSAYNTLNKNGDGKGRSPIAYFKKFKSIPYALPVLISAKEQNFGEFRMHLQYVKYGNVVYKANVWDSTEIFTAEKLKALKGIPKKLGVK